MSRLSREKMREPQRAAQPGALAATPIEVQVTGTGGTGGTAGASVAGVPVVVAPGQELQQAVLDRLRAAAQTAGRSVLARVHDERAGYVIPLRVDPDGSSHLAGDPTPVSAAKPAAVPAAVPTSTPTSAPAPPVPTLAPAPTPVPPVPPVPASAPASPPLAPEPGSGPAADLATSFLRLPSQVSEPVQPMPSAPSPAAPAPSPSPSPSPSSFPPPTPLGENTPTFPLRALPGTVVPPTGVFGPPPVMDVPVPPVSEPASAAPRAEPAPRPASDAEPPRHTGLAALVLGVDPEPAVKPTPTPPRGFDAVAEAVLDDQPPARTPFAEPMARIGDAVKEGRTETAATLAEEALAQASDTLGAGHPEVLRLAELTAYVAYLAGDPERAFRLSLDLARAYTPSGDEEAAYAAYGNVQSAATAWRAVRDPERGLELGRELIAVWARMAAEPVGPAAGDGEQLESARARMDRLTARARQG
ncbi:tetratricopeptide repeat protein [Streptomyces sp. NPDC088789]|uniref:tetratricopeptide repeat protein n=1 Tax=Streptomyces sp. NPDC088789 TaxID=3365899 RepID=UPI00382F66AF